MVMMKKLKKLTFNLSAFSVPHQLIAKQDGELIVDSLKDAEKNIQVHKTENVTNKFIQTNTDLHHT